MSMDLEDTFTEKSNAFISWMNHSGTMYISPKVNIADLRSSGAGRGVVAVAHLSKDEVVIKIPRGSMLSVGNSELGKLVPEVVGLDDWLAMILVLIYETRPTSPWKPYMDILPHSFDTLMYWTPEELLELKGCAVLDKIGKQDAESSFKEVLWPIAQKYPHIFRDTDLQPIELPRLFEVAHRMGSIIMSYSFDMTRPGAENGCEDSDSETETAPSTYKAMIPSADLLNANSTHVNCRIWELPDALAMKVDRQILPGEELLNDYGPLPRSDLLRRYGYVTDAYAVHDVVEMPARLLLQDTPLDEEDKLARVDYLLEEGVLDDSFDIERGLEIPEEAISSIHTILMSKEEFAELKAKGKVPKPKISGAVVGILKQAVESRMGDYATGIEADKNMLESGEISGRRKKMAVEVRLGEKQILRGVLENLRKWESKNNGKRVGSGGGSEDRGAKRSRVC